MKKTIIYILLIFAISITYIGFRVLDYRKAKNEIKRFNFEYEQYVNKHIYGTDVVTIINKAIDNNEKLEIKKDENNNYIENDENSIKIYIKILNTEEKYPMELINKVGINSFINNFNTIKFKSSEVKYHKKTGQLSEITFEELEN